MGISRRLKHCWEDILGRPGTSWWPNAHLTTTFSWVLQERARCPEARLSWALGDYGTLWKSSFRKSGAHPGFPRLSAGPRSQVCAEHDGKGSPRRRWGKGKFEATAASLRGCFQSLGFSWTAAGLAEHSIRACRGPVLTELAASGRFVRGSAPNMFQNHASLLSELRVHLGMFRVWTSQPGRGGQPEFSRM